MKPSRRQFLQGLALAAGLAVKSTYSPGSKLIRKVLSEPETSYTIPEGSNVFHINWYSVSKNIEDGNVRAGGTSQFVAMSVGGVPMIVPIEDVERLENGAKNPYPEGYRPY